MRALIQRVTEAEVTVEGVCIGRIAQGLLVLVCAMQGDDAAAADRLAGRVARLRVFRDEAGKMNRSVQDIGGAALVVSQFTLAADNRSGNRPAFPRPHRRPRANGCIWPSRRRSAIWACRWKPAVLAPTCAWRWSTTAP